MNYLNSYKPSCFDFKNYNWENISITDENNSSSDSDYVLSEKNLESISSRTIKMKTSSKKVKGTAKLSRKIKDRSQLEFLEEFFKLDPEWTKSTISFISKFMNLTPLQLYKWGYDQKRKNSCKKGIRNKVRENRRVTLSEQYTDYNLMVDQLFQDVDKNDQSNSRVTLIQFEKLREKYFNRSENASTQEGDIQIESKEMKNHSIPTIFHFDFDWNIENYCIFPEFNVKAINSSDVIRDGEQDFFYDPRRFDGYLY